MTEFDGYEDGWWRGMFDKCNGLPVRDLASWEPGEYNDGYKEGYADAYAVYERKI